MQRHTAPSPASNALEPFTERISVSFQLARTSVRVSLSLPLSHSRASEFRNLHGEAFTGFARLIRFVARTMRVLTGSHRVVVCLRRFPDQLACISLIVNFFLLDQQLVLPRCATFAGSCLLSSFLFAFVSR